MTTSWSLKILGVAVVCGLLATVMCQESEEDLEFSPAEPEPITNQRFNVTTKGKSGRMCGRGRWRRVRCVDAAKCIRGKCVCPKGQQGDGRFLCVSKDVELCMVGDDNQVTSFSGATTSLRFGCSTRLAKLLIPVTHLPEGDYCVVEIYGESEYRGGGKFYPSGIWMQFTFPKTQGTQTVVNLVKLGSVKKKKFHFDVALDGRFKMTGEKAVMTQNDITVECKFDKNNNMAIIDTKELNVTVHFRPANLDELNGKRKKFSQCPAIFITAPKNVKWNSLERFADFSVCAAPIDSKTYWESVKHDWGLENPVEAVQMMAVTVLSQIPPAEKPDVIKKTRPECAVFSVPDMDTKCDRRAEAICACGPLLYDDKLYNCLTESPFLQLRKEGHQVLYSLFKKCLSFMCAHETTKGEDLCRSVCEVADAATTSRKKCKDCFPWPLKVDLKLVCNCII